MKKIRALLFSTLLMSGVYAQSYVSPGATQFRNSITDPTAAQFRNVDFSEMNHFTGTPNINIPLYEIKLKSFTLPIQLAYDVNEIRPNTITSSTGFGWRLVAGGKISRQVNDRPDDVIMRSPGGGRGFTHGYKYGYIYGGREQADYITGRLNNRANIPSYFLEIDLANYAQDMFLKSREGVGMMPNCAPQLYSTIGKGFYRGHDTGPDWFSMSVNNKSSQFLLGDYQTRNINFIKYENVDGQYTIDPAFNANPGFSSPYDYMKGIDQFTITDENGNKFIFATKDKIKMYGRTRDVPYLKSNDLATNDYYGSIGVIGEYYSDWNLTTVITVDNERIDFEYVQEEVVMYQKSYNSRELNNAIDYTVTPFGTGNGSNRISNDRLTLTRIAKTQNRLKRIVSGYTVVNFSTYDQRPDLLNSYYISQIVVSTNTPEGSHTDKSYSLNYTGGFPDNDHSSSYTPRNAGDDLSNRDWMMGSFWFPNDRISYPSIYNFLLSIEESVTGERHLFNYSIPGEGASFPQEFITGLYYAGFMKNSFDIDYWGYYNGSYDGSNKTNKSPYPTIYVHPALNGADRFTVFPFNDGTQEYTLWGANRNCNPASVTIGTLKEIVYPTGGRQSFEFEANQFYYRGANRLGGGLRIKKITLKDSTARQEYTRSYEYLNATDPDKTSGHLFNMPVFAYNENMPYMYSRYTNSLVSPGTDYTNNPAAYYAAATWHCEHPTYSDGSFEMTSVGYDHVREHLDNDGTRGLIDYEFSVPASIDNPQNDDLGLMSRPGVIPINKSIYYSIFFMNDCDQTNHLLSIDASTGNALLNYIDVAPTSYGAGPSVNYDWNRGLLLSKKKCFYDGSPAEEEKFEYAFFQKNGNALKYPGVAVAVRTNIGLYEAAHFDNYLQFITCSPYYFLTNVSRVLKKQEKTTYSHAFNWWADAVYPYVKKEYTYDNFAQVQKITTNGSKGELFHEFFTYPYNYSVQGNTDPVIAGINNLMAKHVITKPVESYSVVQKPNGSQDVIKGIIQFFNPQKPVADSAKEIFIVPVGNFTPSSVVNANGRYEFRYDNDYIKGHYLDQYDANNNLQHVHEAWQNGVVSFWDYQMKYQTCNTINSTFAETAYEGFESQLGAGNFTVNVTSSGNAVSTGTPPTGRKYLVLNYLSDITKAIPDPQKHYILSFWVSNGQINVTNTNVIKHTVGKTTRTWTYHEYEIAGGSNVRITANGSGALDELRFHPVQAQMTTYTYDPNVGITSICDENNDITHFLYDDAGRLVCELDTDWNVKKLTSYSYYFSGAQLQSLQTRSMAAPMLNSKIDRSSTPKDCYIKLVANATIENGDEYYKAGYADYYLYFYADASCTTPLTLTTAKSVILRSTQEIQYTNGKTNTFDSEIKITAEPGIEKKYIGNFIKSSGSNDQLGVPTATCSKYDLQLLPGNGYLIK